MTEVINADSRGTESDDIISPVSKRRRKIESETNSETSDKEDSLEWIHVTESEKISNRKQFTSGERSTPHLNSNITELFHFLNYTTPTIRLKKLLLKSVVMPKLN